MIVLDGWDDCIIGVAQVDGSTRVIYSRSKMIDQMAVEGSTEGDAEEFIAYNVDRAIDYIDGPAPVVVREVSGRDEVDYIADCLEATDIKSVVQS